MTHHRLDLRGLLCPLPILKLKKLHASLHAPATIEMLATDPMVLVDVPVFCAEHNLKIILQEQRDGHIYFQIELIAPPQRGAVELGSAL